MTEADMTTELVENTGTVEPDVVNITELEAETDKSMLAPIPLPKFETLTQQRVLREVQAAFKGFDIPSDVQLDKAFEDFDSLAAYAVSCYQEIVAFDGKSKVAQITAAAADMVRKWTLGHVLTVAMEKHTYGGAAAHRLAAKLNISLPNLYHLCRVGKSYTMQEAYAMGLYDAGWGNVRSLAYVADVDTRKQIIKAYCDSIGDWNDAPKRAVAKMALARAIKSAAQGDYEEVASGDPAGLLSAGDVMEEAPEYVEASKQLTRLVKALRAFNTDNVEAFCCAFDNYYIKDSVSGAITLNEELTTLAKDALQRIETLVPLLGSELKASVQSLSFATVQKTEEDNGESDEA